MVRAWSKPRKINWQGRIKAVQPRIRLVRSFDERYHNYLGYVLCIEGTCGDESGEFLVAVGKATHERHRFRAGMVVRGSSVPVQDPRLEIAGLYKTSGIKIEKNGEDALSMSESTMHHAYPGPPFVGVPPDLATYRSRGHRRLDAKTYQTRCTTCIWGCRMPVEMIIDHWNPSKKKYRFETFCYGPKSCSFYRPGPKRKVPGRKGMSYVEEDWVDQDVTSHRGPDD